jgi:hypothetical protein
MLLRMSPELPPLRHAAMSVLRSLSGESGHNSDIVKPTRLTQRRSGGLLDDFIRECEHRGRDVEAKSLGSRI